MSDALDEGLVQRIDARGTTRWSGTCYPPRVQERCFNMAMGINGRNAYPDILKAKQDRIREPHVKTLNDLADKIAAAEGFDPGDVPYVDPDLGGLNARALVMLDNPGPKAKAGVGSGLLSLDNDDPTARCLREAYERHHIAWTDIGAWNAVPFPTAKRGSSATERQAGALWLRDFVQLCPSLEFVLPLGAAARDGWKRAGLPAPVAVPGITWDVPHCSRLGLNQPGARERFEKAIECLANTLNS